MPLNTLPDSEVLAKSAAMAVAFTPDRYAYLLSLLPTPEGYAALHNSLEGNYTGLLKGDPDKTKAFQADRQAVNVDLSLILGLAKIVAVKDPTVPASLGVDPPEKRRLPRRIWTLPMGSSSTSIPRVTFFSR